MTSPRLTVLFVHPSPDLYGSDLQLVETVRAVHDAGHRATALLPAAGPLTGHLARAGADVEVREFPVLRKSVFRPRAFLAFVWTSLTTLRALTTIVRKVDPDVIYVNTLTIPLWSVVAMLTRRPLICHVHEAEDRGPTLLRKGLFAPLLAARGVIVNSDCASDALVSVLPRLERRIVRIYNGVPDRAAGAPRERSSTAPVQIGFVGRLSPRKGPDLLLDAAAALIARGHDVQVRIAGSTFAGYEWFEEQLRTRAALPDLTGRVTFSGYIDDVPGFWHHQDVAVVPSRLEPFGNTAVEAQLSALPVIAARVQGLTEIIGDGDTGFLVDPDDATALADALQHVIDLPDHGVGVGARARTSALSRFGIDRYRHEVLAEIAHVARSGRATSSPDQPRVGR